jgi:hypothetical protein
MLHTRPAGTPTFSQREQARLGLDRFRHEMAAAGVLRDLVVLDPDAEAARVVFQGGRVAAVEHGPFDEAQVLTAFCTIETTTREEALAWVSRWPTAPDGEARIELRDSGCPGGVMAIMAEPAANGQAPTLRRYAVLLRANPQLDAEVLAPQPRLDAMTRRNEEGTARGVLVAGEGLKGSARATRRHARRGTSHLVDGPFTEIKELVAGYWIVQVPALQDAVEWVRQYPYPFDDVVVDLRGVDPRPLHDSVGPQADARCGDAAALALHAH